MRLQRDVDEDADDDRQAAGDDEGQTPRRLDVDGRDHRTHDVAWGKGRGSVGGHRCSDGVFIN